MRKALHKKQEIFSFSTPRVNLLVVDRPVELGDDELLEEYGLDSAEVCNLTVKGQILDIEKTDLRQRLRCERGISVIITAEDEALVKKEFGLELEYDDYQVIDTTTGMVKRTVH